MAKLFGTDGIRDVANQGALEPGFVLRVGRALGLALRERPEGFGPPLVGTARARLPREPRGPAVLIGRDTRRSGGMIEAALTAGLASAGVSVFQGGVLPTPAVAFLTERFGLDAGVVVSASHNPKEFNGIKVFGRGAVKASDEAEERIEALAAGGPPAPRGPVGDVTAADSLREEYIRASVEKAPAGGFIRDLPLALDCANGAAGATAPEVFRRLGARLRLFGAEPDGDNINEGCGALVPEALQKKLQPGEIGLVFDGDADRLILIDEKGGIRDGDHILGLVGAHLSSRGQLPQKNVVATVMSNLGLEVFLRERGIALARTPVGDRNVVEAMLKGDHPLGGEQAGHIIFSPYARTGDGLWTALLVLRVLAESGRPLHELAGEVPRYPQIVLNVAVREKPPLDSIPEVARATREVEQRLGQGGRLVLRYSGTEPLARVMIEGPEAALIRSMAESLASAIRSAIGAAGKTH